MATSWDIQKKMEFERGRQEGVLKKRLENIYVCVYVYVYEKGERERGDRRRQKEWMMMNESTEILGPLAFGAAP